MSDKETCPGCGRLVWMVTHSCSGVMGSAGEVPAAVAEGVAAIGRPPADHFRAAEALLGSLTDADQGSLVKAAHVHAMLAVAAELRGIRGLLASR